MILLVKWTEQQSGPTEFITCALNKIISVLYSCTMFAAYVLEFQLYYNDRISIKAKTWNSIAILASTQKIEKDIIRLLYYGVQLTVYFKTLLLQQ